MKLSNIILKLVFIFIIIIICISPINEITSVFDQQFDSSQINSIEEHDNSKPQNRHESILPQDNKSQTSSAIISKDNSSSNSLSSYNSYVSSNYNQIPNDKKYATIAIRCDIALQNYNNMDKKVQNDRIIPKTGVILNTTKVEISNNTTVFDVLIKITKQKRIHLDYQGSKSLKNIYIKGINNLYEFDGGSLSGWQYKVNGIYANIGADNYIINENDNIEWHYTCDLGRDLN